MPRWNHTLHLKELWKERTGDDDGRARTIADIVAQRVTNLANRQRSKDPHLADALDEIAEGFAAVPADEEPSEMFNGMLVELYDLGDRARIWIA